MKSKFIEALQSIQPPWLHYCVMDVSSTTNTAFKLRGEYIEKFITLRLRGSKMRTISGLFNEFGAALQFPYYFGENWNAFDECVKDLSWLYASGFVLIVHDADQILIEATDSEGQIQSLLRILNSAAKEWSIPVEKGVAWDRPSKPFHVIFQVTPDKADNFRIRLSKTGGDISEL
jgi:hypothetical protein